MEVILWGWTTSGDGAKVPTIDLEACIFCELVAGKLPISVVDETEDVLAFMDIQPVNPGHVLIIPKRHAPYLADLDSALVTYELTLDNSCEESGGNRGPMMR